MRVSINDEILKDIANSIRSKTDSTDLMYPQQMSGNIDGITVSKTQSKSVTITQNGTETITPDSNYNGLSSVEVTTAVPLQSKSVTITSNGTSTITPDTNYEGMTSIEVNTNVALDLSNYFTNTITNGSSNASGVLSVIKNISSDITVSGTSLAYAFQSCINLISIPLMNTSSVTNMQNMCAYCSSLTTVPSIDTSHCTTMQNAFYECTNLVNLPVLSFASVSGNTSIMNVFYGCTSLSNESLNNILLTCANANPQYFGSKTLARIGLTQAQATTCMGLSNYTAFTNAGWTTGY